MKVILLASLSHLGWKATVFTGWWLTYPSEKYLRGGTRKVGKQERNRRKNEGERGGKNT